MAGFFKRLFGGSSDDQKQKEIKAKAEQATSEVKAEEHKAEQTAKQQSEQKTAQEAQTAKEEKQSFLSKAEEEAKHFADNLAHKAEEVKEEVVEKASTAYQESKDFVQETKDKALDSAHNLKEEAEKAASDLAKEALESISHAKEAVTEKASQVASEVSEKVKEKTEAVTEALLDTVAEVKEEAKDGAQEASQKASQASEAAKETLAETVAESKEAVAETVKEEVHVNAESTPAPAAEEPKKKKGFFSRLVSGLSKTKDNLGAGIVTLFRGKKISKELFTELEDRLLMADVGLDTTDKIIAKLTDHVKITELNDADVLYTQLKEELREIIEPCAQPLEIKDHKPYLILMLGVNGVGKTTTIGKITKKLQMEGKSVVLAAADTFRAAAIEQLQEWGHRNNVPVIAQKPGSDSAAVIYDALSSAKAKGIDVVIADTAGRLQNKEHLLEELKKIVRVVQKIDPRAPHEVMITLDASTGQNAISQVEAFDKAVPITGINLTKLDGTAKGGVIFAICDKFKKPIRFIGVGEKIDDLQPFQADEFINALFKDK